MIKKLTIENLGCANCAMKMEDKIKALDFVDDASINFTTKSLQVESKEDLGEKEYKLIDAIISSVEADAHLKKDKLVEKKGALEKKEIEILIPLLIYFSSFFVTDLKIKNILLYLSYIIVARKIVYRSVLGLFKNFTIDENLLMTVSSIGAIIIGEISEGVGVMIFYIIGEYFQDRAVDKSRKSIANLMDIKSDFTSVIRSGIIEIIPSEQVEIGEIILVKPGEKIPLDSKIIKGSSTIDTSNLTGESLPTSVNEGDSLLSGSINLTKNLKLQVEKKFSDSAVAKILKLVEESSAKKAPTEKFISKFARYYTPIVIGLAILLATIPPLAFNQDYKIWVYRAFVFLVASCPCALVISVPLAFFAGIGRSSRDGLLIKGGNYLEALSKAKSIIFDKTGTLTKGQFELSKIEIENKKYTEDQALYYAALAESQSNHPIGQSILRAYGREITELVEIEDLAGKGIVAKIDGKEILVGNDKLMEMKAISYKKNSNPTSLVYLAIDQEYVGSLEVKDQIKDHSKETITSLKALGLENIMMLTGDNEEVAKVIASEIGIKDIKAKLLPQDKLSIIENYMKTQENPTIFVGDGINDAPSLVRSDVGIAMGGIGSDAAIEAADVVIMEDDLSKLPKLIKISKKAMEIIYQNIIFALGFKLIVLILGALGLTSMWVAVLADAGVAILAILNSIRILSYKAE